MGDRKALPVVIVDDHHHCLPDIHLAIRQRRLPFTEIHVIHVDAHPDLSFMTTIDTNAIFEPAKLYDLLDDSVAGSLGVTSELSHFVEDDLFCAVEDMVASSVRYWDLFVTELNSATDEVSARLATEEAIDNARGNSKRYILDVDLDYFSTWNPFRRGLEACIGESAVAIVTRVFSCVRYKSDTLGVMTPKERCSERRTFSELIKRLQAADAHENKSTRFSEWAEVVGELAALYPPDADAEQLFCEFARILEQNREDEVPHCEIWAAGPFLDLPHHESSQEEIECMVDDLEQFLRKHALDASNLPALVTIAKSTGDEFLPPKQLDAVLTTVLQMLERVFGELSTQFVEYDPVEGVDEMN
ncbi:hypothetical protein BBO99_00008636 [Phytophthora kernoviae]|uniref:Uncharacterized protein n=2 Tax=Phytophthora kernoviae TaxID=325452 RepID=A0A3R7KQ45_9STRA|nr:hypothetical protein G195_010481 [Phytophthora kernoviae 00238/432]KAG2508025.1 hypothetical protein JM16_008797 [Phytophthora kernoviae]KAG2510603.1 hypothetical protein JM18_008829 [Phytophthora kernoviae]RLN02670.1 hypothetical protein BBI17_008323 [Phytophthora kernoviae]RLN74955.1 hypothetical protein BBO99_00008636 [Phytophthora kernoviae]